MFYYTLRDTDDNCIAGGYRCTAEILDVKITERCNSGTDLTVGSVCSTMTEITFVSAGNMPQIAPGAELFLEKIEDDGGPLVVYRRRIVSEKPIRVSTNRYKMTAYDRIVRLNKDISLWLLGLDGWPYTVEELAKLVCEQCGLSFVSDPESFFNAAMEISEPVMIQGMDSPDEAATYRPLITEGTTGRTVMRWLAEIAAAFCVANDDGDIEFRYYENTLHPTIKPTGDGWKEPHTIPETIRYDNYYFEGSLSYEDYQVQPCDGVIFAADDGTKLVYPQDAEPDNPYLFSGNKFIPLLKNPIAAISAIRGVLSGIQYTPVRISVPGSLGIRAGQYLDIVDRNGTQIRTIVMQAVLGTDRTVLESTGNYLRNSAESADAVSEWDMIQYADTAVAKLRAEFTAEHVGTLMYRRSLKSSDDLDSLTQNGIYLYTSTNIPQNAPYNAASIVLVFGSLSDTSQKIQCVIRYGQVGFWTFRTLTGGVWGAWEELATKSSAAPAGFGLGGAKRITAEELDTTRAPGWYYISEEMTIGGITVSYWYMHVKAYATGSKHAMQYLYPVRNSGMNEMRRMCHSEVWDEWEHEDPPMVPGTTYRTTKRWNNKPVYAVAVSGRFIGAATDVAAKDIPVGAAIIGISGIVTRETDSGLDVFSVGSAGAETIRLFENGDVYSIRFGTSSGDSWYYNINVVLEYVKDETTAVEEADL